MTDQPSREGIFAASDLATRGKDNGTPARTDHNKIRARSICDGNFLFDIVLFAVGQTAVSGHLTHKSPFGHIVSGQIR